MGAPGILVALSDVRLGWHPGAEPAFYFPSTCPAKSAAFPFPSNPVGTLANILNTGVIKVAYNQGLVQTSQTGLMIQDGTQNPPVGMAPSLMNAIALAVCGGSSRALAGVCGS